VVLGRHWSRGAGGFSQKEVIRSLVGCAFVGICRIKKKSGRGTSGDELTNYTLIESWQERHQCGVCTLLIWASMSHGK